MDGMPENDKTPVIVTDNFDVDPLEIRLPKNNSFSPNAFTFFTARSYPQ